MTSQCASGSGQFLENIARYLGVAVGLGTLGLAIISTVLGLFVLALIGRVEHQIHKDDKPPKKNRR